MGKVWGTDQWLDAIVTLKENAPVLTSSRQLHSTNMFKVVENEKTVWNAQGLATLKKFDAVVRKIAYMDAYLKRNVTYEEWCQPLVPSQDLMIGSQQDKAVNGQECRVYSILSISGFHSNLPLDQLNHLEKERNGSKVFVMRDGAYMPSNALMSGIKRNGTGAIVAVSSFFWKGFVKPSMQLDSEIKFNDRFVAFFAKLADTLYADDQFGVYDVIFSPSINVSARVDPVVVVGLIIAILSVTVFSGMRCGVGSKVLVSFFGFVNTMLAIGAAFGMVFAVTDSISGWSVVSAILVVVIGLDDVYLLIFACRRAEGTPAQRLSHGVGEAASSILMTTLTDLVVFGSGLTSPMKGPFDFALLLVIGLVLDFVLQLTFFTAILFLDLKREAKQVHEFVGCFEKGKDAEDIDVEKNEKRTRKERDAKKRISGKIEIYTAEGARLDMTNTSEKSMGQSATMTTNTSSSGVTKVQESARTESSGLSGWSLDEERKAKVLDTWVSRFLFDVWSPLLVKRPCQVISLVLTLVLIGSGVFGVFFTRFDDVRRTDITNGVSRASQFQEYTRNHYTHNEDAYVMFPSSLNYADPVIQSKILDVCKRIPDLPESVRIRGYSIECWMEAFQKWNNNTLPSDATTFVSKLKEMTASGVLGSFRRHLMFSKDGSRLEESRIDLKVLQPKTKTEALFQNKTVHDVLGDGIAYSWVTWEITEAKNTEDIVQGLIPIAIISGLGVLIVSSVLLINPYSCAIVLLGMLVTSGGTMTLMYLLGYPFLSSTLFVTVATIGLGVDFGAHIIHTFNTAKAFSVVERLQVAFGSIGPAVFFGAVTNLSVGLLIIGNGGTSQMILIMLFSSSALGLIWAWVSVPLFLQAFTPPVAVRDANMEDKLRKKKISATLDDVWAKDFSKK
eukprot:TRINITY_DN8292_c0_g1_i1.p1 TRINITY_DN8292_c0_g1~~TRINITY_DN8292_c0_g1_i1.p1  ORF type:complete len:1010 (-),score=303.60 TRINITY_DN8292_c0_g1_i1:43-2739(-)